MAKTAYAYPMETVVTNFLESDDGVAFRTTKRGGSAPLASMFTQMANKLGAR